MKTSIIKVSALTLTLVLLTGCQVFEPKYSHTRLLVDTLQTVCGKGAVKVQAMAKQGDIDSESFQFECTIDGEGFNNGVQDKLFD